MVKRAAIISAGPSVVDTYDPAEPFDVRVTVNSSAQLFESDWWSVADPENFVRQVPKGAPKLLVMHPEPERYTAARERYLQHEVMGWDELKAELDDPPKWRFSVTAAILLAYHLGARQIEVFGHDMDGIVDCGGYSVAKRKQNWRKIVPVWQVVEKWLGNGGATLHQHTPKTGTV